MIDPICLAAWAIIAIISIVIYFIRYRHGYWETIYEPLELDPDDPADAYEIRCQTEQAKYGGAWPGGIKLIKKDGGK